MFRIGEFSKLTQVSVRMLRYYDENGLLKPAKVDAMTGYRLYAAEQIPILNRIISLRDAGFGVAEIGVLVNNWSEANFTNALKNKKREIEGSIQSEQEKLSMIGVLLSDTGQTHKPLPYDVSIKSIPSYHVLSYRKVLPNYFAEGELWKEMAAAIKANHIPVTGETFSIYCDPEYKENDVDVELCAFTTYSGGNIGGLIVKDTEPVEKMACTMVHGPFEKIAGSFLAFADWLTRHEQYGMGQASRQIVHRGPWNENNPDNFLTEIQIPLEKRSR